MPHRLLMWCALKWRSPFYNTRHCEVSQVIVSHHMPSSQYYAGRPGEPFNNPLFGEGPTPLRPPFTPATNPVWSPQPTSGPIDAAMVPALPPPPSDFLALAAPPPGQPCTDESPMPMTSYMPAPLSALGCSSADRCASMLAHCPATDQSFATEELARACTHAQGPMQVMHAGMQAVPTMHSSCAGAGAAPSDAAAEEGAFADVVAELMQERIDAPEGVCAPSRLPAATALPSCGARAACNAIACLHSIVQLLTHHWLAGICMSSRTCYVIAVQPVQAKHYLRLMTCIIMDQIAVLARPHAAAARAVWAAPAAACMYLGGSALSLFL